MSFHLDLEFSADCKVWREILAHESLIEKQSVGALAGTYGALPPAVLSHFLTHRHTHQALLPERERALLQRAERERQFTFDRNPSKIHYDESRNLDRGGLYALTHSAFAEQAGSGAAAGASAADDQRRGLAGQHPHAFLAEHYPQAYPQRLPTHQALHYLHPPAPPGTRHELYPRAAQSYARGPWHESHLQIASAAAAHGPHPSLRQHPETSTFRRATTGRRHIPFPASIARGGEHTPRVEATSAAAAVQPSKVEESKENGNSMRVPPQGSAFGAASPSTLQRASQVAFPLSSPAQQQQQQQPQWQPRPPSSSQRVPSRPISSRGVNTVARPASRGSLPPLPLSLEQPRTPASASQRSIPPSLGAHTSRSIPIHALQYNGGSQSSRVAASPAPRSSGRVETRESSSTSAAAASNASSSPAPVQRLPSSSAAIAASSTTPGLAIVTQPGVAHPSQAGFAPHAQQGVAQAAAHAAAANTHQAALLQTLPTAYAANAQHAFDHRSGFGSRGVFSVMPRPKADQMLHASHVCW